MKWKLLGALALTAVLCGGRLEAKPPEPAETGEVDPVAQGRRVREFLQRPSVLEESDAQILRGAAPARPRTFRPPGRPHPSNLGLPTFTAPVPVGNSPPPTAWPPRTMPPNTTSDLRWRRMVELRDSAWRLEQTAWMLERASLYEQADKVRELARQLRLDARQARERLESSPPESGNIFAPSFALPAQ
jgi:hypothetical protein